MSARQRVLVFAAIVVTVLVAAGLLLYSMAEVQSYDGIFVSGMRQVWLR